MKLLADMIEQDFKSHSIGRADLEDQVLVHVWHIPDPDAKVLIHMAPPLILVSLAKRPRDTGNPLDDIWWHRKPVRLHLGNPDFMGYFFGLVETWATTPVNTAVLTEEGEDLERYLK